MNEFVKQIGANYFQSSKITNKKIVTVGTYPALELIIEENKEHTGFIVNMTMINWIIFFEDKIIILQGGGLSNDFERLLPTFYSITNSVIFPEQYEK
jgi:aspartate oxidase